MPMKSLLHSMLLCLHFPKNEHMYSRLHVILTVDSACFNCEEQIIMSSRPKRNDMQKLLCVALFHTCQQKEGLYCRGTFSFSGDFWFCEIPYIAVTSL